MGSGTVRVMNVTARLCSNPTDIAARTQSATIQITVSAKQNLAAAVANLASNTSSQAGRCFIALVNINMYLLYCTISDLSSCFIARSLQTTLSIIQRAVTKTGLPMTVLEM